MALVATIDNYHHLEDMFKDAGRKDQFSLEGIEALFNMLEEYSDATGEDVKIDIIALCCEYTEMSIEDVKEEYGLETDEEAIAEIEDRSGWFDELGNGNIIFQDF